MMKGNEKWLETTTLSEVFLNHDVALEIQPPQRTGQPPTLRFCIAASAQYRPQVAQFVSGTRAMEGRTPSDFWVMANQQLNTYGQVRILTITLKTWRSTSNVVEPVDGQLILPGFEPIMGK